MLQNGFKRNVDHPTLPDHIYYEGYFHALPTSKPALSLNPRSGMDFEKPAAPLRLRAFVEAVRRLNDSWIREAFSGAASFLPRPLPGSTEAGGAVDAGSASSSSSSSAAAAAAAAAAGAAAASPAAPTKASSKRAASTSTAHHQDPVLGHLHKLYQRGMHFADLAVQVHFGDEVDAGHAAWHKDAINSSLHMALSLGGNRALHTKHVTNPADKSIAKHVHWQQPGSVYVSSPYLFGHAVQYEQCTWDTRIIAVQCRFLMQLEDLRQLSFAGEDALAETLASVMSTHRIRVPDLEMVKAVEAELSKKTKNK